MEKGEMETKYCNSQSGNITRGRCREISAKGESRGGGGERDIESKR
jgi:hypothetical protein